MAKTGKSSGRSDFSPKILQMGTKDWAGVAGLMLLGALVGLIVSLLIPPQYEAVSKLTTNLEIVTNTNVTEIMVDAQLDLVGTLVFHTDVVDQVLLSLADEGISLTADELTNKTSIERQLMTTLIKVRDRDPQVAEKIATSFAEQTFKRLNEAYPHALTLSEAKATQVMLNSCLKDTKKQELPFCQSLTQGKAEQLISETETVILRESPLSLGLTGEINISQYQPASLPERPIAFQRSTLILSGTMVGLVLALILGEVTTKEQERE